MDLQMPVMDGYEASMRIKSINERQKICAVTSYTKEICQRRCDQVGIDFIMHKPVNFVEFKKQILKFVF
jgi:CheY-like chemotaxis protein